MPLTLTIEDSSEGKALKINGILYLEDVTDDSSSDEDNQDEADTDLDNTDSGETDSGEGEGTGNEGTEDSGTGDSSDGNEDVVGYGKLKTLLNIRSSNSLDADIVTVYKKDTIVFILQIMDDSWLRIVCEESDSGYAYVRNTDGSYVIIGKSVYTVEKGDTIKSIAADLLGDEERYTEIKELNEMTSNVVSEGLVLLIPEV